MFLFCVRYTLAQEHGDLINLHDWFQSFKTVVLQPSTKGKHKPKQSPLSKKRKYKYESENKSEASIQYPLGFSLVHHIVCSLVGHICSEMFVAVHGNPKTTINVHL
jgi:hypothetical protein